MLERFPVMIPILVYLLSVSFVGLIFLIYLTLYDVYIMKIGSKENLNDNLGWSIFMGFLIISYFCIY